MLIKIILSSPGERARLAASPRAYAGPLVDFVLGGLLAAGPARPGEARAADGVQPRP